MAATIAALPESLLERLFLAIEPCRRQRVEGVCRRWRDVSRGSSALWEAISWIGSVDTAVQASSLSSLLTWLCSRALPPRQLRLHLCMDIHSQWVSPWTPGHMAQTWLLLGAVLAHCAPRLQRLTIVQDYPGIHDLDCVDDDTQDMCLPELGAWLLPCRVLQRLEVVTPHIMLVRGALRRLPALHHLLLKVNMATMDDDNVLDLELLRASQLASTSLNSLDLSESDMQLQPGALASLPRLRRLVASNIQFPHAEEEAEPGAFSLLLECADRLEELQLHSYKQVVPPQLSALTKLRRLLVLGLRERASPEVAEELGQALALLPLLEALCLADNLALSPVDQQQRFWAAWQPTPPHLRSLELQCGAASQLPPAAAAHLQGLHTLVCDWEALCNSPGMLAGCSQLRQLRIVCNGPPRKGASKQRLPRRLVSQLMDHLAAMPELAAVQLFNFKYSPVAAVLPMPDQAARLLSDVAARLPGVLIPPVVVAGHEGVLLDLWAA